MVAGQEGYAVAPGCILVQYELLGDTSRRVLLLSYSACGPRAGRSEKSEARPLRLVIQP